MLIHPIKRRIKFKKNLCAYLVSGSEKIRSGFGNGDCLLLDFKNLIFAAADASERFPEASKLLLERFHYYLSLETNVISDIAFHEYLKNAWSEQNYNYKTTFSCVFLKQTANGSVDVTIANGGDSKVIIIDLISGSIVFKTLADMNFAGRSKNLPKIDSININDKNLRIIITTDGFNDFFSNDFYQYLNLSSDNYINKILTEIDEKKEFIDHDDIGMIILNPFSDYNGQKNIFLMGGTTPHEEYCYYAALKKIPKDDIITNTTPL
ncbi:MAG: hypothetical protein HQK76_02150 [Desulfobacterales bacterium]|nr:hypothetical protein [Desulfobacterales bacterium]